MIARLLYRNPQILFLLICTIVVAGISSYNVLPRLEDPILGKRVGVITTILPGADSTRVESLVTIKLEEELLEIPEIEQIRSNSGTGVSNLTIELRDEVDDVDEIWSIVRDRMESAQGKLPEACLPSELDVLALKAFAAIIAVKPSDESRANFALLRKVARRVRTELTNLPGTESVHLFGDPGEEYVVDVRPESIAPLNLSTASIARQIVANTLIRPAGFARHGNEKLLLELEGQIDSVESLGSTNIRYGPGDQFCSLAEIASVHRSIVEHSGNWALIDGERSIVLGAFVHDELRVDRWTSDLDNAISTLNQQVAGEAEIEVVFSQSEYVDKRLDHLLRNLLLGTCAVVCVVLLLMGWRSMIIVGTSLPLSALMVLSGMRSMDIPIHQVSVTGLIVALGLLIDNAIIMVEDIRSRMFRGADASVAITSSVRHLAIPLFGSTLTTTLALLPIAMLPGPPGEFVGTLAVSVILAISASFLLAMTVVPAMFRLTGFDSASHGLFNYGITSGFAKKIYASSLDFVFRFPLFGVALGAALPALGFWFARQLPEQFFPPSDRNQVQVEIELQARDSAARTIATVESMQATFAEHGQIERAHWFVGGSAPTFFYNLVPRRRGTPFYGQAIVDLKESADAEQLVRTLQERLDDNHPECRAVVRQLEQGPPFDAPIELRVVGPDLRVLHQLGEELRLILSQTSHVIHTRSDFQETIPKLTVRTDPQETARAKLTGAEISQQLYASLQGAAAGTILVADEELPVRVKLAGSGRSQLDQVAALPLQVAAPVAAIARPGMGQPPRSHPPLSAVADFDLGSDRSAIVRINNKRTNEVKAYIETGVLPSRVIDAFDRQLAQSDFRLPEGYTVEFGGEKEERSSAVQGLITNAAVLFSLMILSLVASFRSFRCAAIVAMVGGLAIGLGPLSLWLFEYPFGFMAIVGTMGLVGVAINDSIVVLAAICASETAMSGNREDLRNVVIDATRHVLTTTLTTIVGFLPLILAGGGFWPPLAISIAGGVGGATFLALYFVPSMALILKPKTTF